MFDMVDLRGKYILRGVALLFGAVLLLVNACQRDDGDTDEAYKKAFLSKIYALRNNEDSLKLLLNKCIERDDDAGAIIAYRQLGKYQRDNARFSDAIASHQEGLNLALKVRDTLEIVQALNNLGTIFAGSACCRKPVATTTRPSLIPRATLRSTNPARA